MRAKTAAILAILLSGEVLPFAGARAQHASTLQTPESVVVYGTLSNSDIGVSSDKVPGTLQTLDADQLAAAHGGTVLDAMGSRVTGAALSDSQGNNMFEDVRIHGFEASPLQGTPQGLAVYQNGIRLNEAFGDTVNWDAIPQAAIARMDVWSNNPVFGLNALGGAVNVVMKNGFTWQGMQASAQGGSYSHGMGTLQYGMQDGGFSFYGAVEGITDGGWRLQSQSNLGRLYADLGWRMGDSEVHLVASGAQSALGVVGPTPVQLIARNSAAVYTYPQTTQNRIGSLAVNGKSKLNDNWQLEGTAYVRTLRQRHIDGNDGDFESCSTRSSYGGKLCLEDDAFGTPAGGKTTAFRDQFVLMGPAGQTFAYTGAIVYGTDDRTSTDSTSQGVTLQLTGNAPLFGLGNYLTAGGSIDHGSIGFHSSSTLARIYPNLEVAPDPAVPGAGTVIHTLGNLGYAPADLAGTTDYYGLYLVDAVDITDALTITAGARLNAADIVTRDRSGINAELSGSHGYTHLNPLAGITYKFMDGLSFFGGYSEANRAPTPLELDCASATQPCLLEGSLVADPPLHQVVTHTGEVGLRGKLGAAGGTLNWSASVFRADSENDIVALASVIQGRGYFTNVPLTRRQGVDVSGQFMADGWSAYMSYSYLDATYEFSGALASPNNPKADGNGNVPVTPGRHLPVNPANQLHAGGDVELFPDFSLGGDLIFTGSRYFDGDNANQNPKLPSYWVVNLRAAYDMQTWELFGEIDNLFDGRDATYGTYFSTDDTVGLLTPALTDPRSLTLEQPISFQIGIKLRL